MMHDTLTCEHPQCHGLTNLHTEAEQIEMDYKKGEKVRIGMIQLDKIIRVKIIGSANYKYHSLNRYKHPHKRKAYMKKYNEEYNAKLRYKRNRDKAFAFFWKLQIEWLLK